MTEASIAAVGRHRQGRDLRGCQLAGGPRRAGLVATVAAGARRSAEHAISPGEHREAAVVEPNKPYAADVEIWPTSIVVPLGYTLAVTVQGPDFAFPHLTSGVYRGSALFMREGSDSRLYGGTQALHTGGEYDSYLLLPAMPADRPVVKPQR